MSLYLQQLYIVYLLNSNLNFTWRYKFVSYGGRQSHHTRQALNSTLLAYTLQKYVKGLGLGLRIRWWTRTWTWTRMGWDGLGLGLGWGGLDYNTET